MPSNARRFAPGWCRCDVANSLANGTPEATFGKEAIEAASGFAIKTGPVASYAYPADGLNGTGPQVLHDWLRRDGTDFMGILTAPGTIAPGGLND